jgi:class 3 adenylate cyclase
MAELPSRPDDLTEAIVACGPSGFGADQVAAASPCLEVSLQQTVLGMMPQRQGRRKDYPIVVRTGRVAESRTAYSPGTVEFASVLEADQTRLPTGNRASCNTPAVRSLTRGGPARTSSGPLDQNASSGPRLTRRLAAILAADIAGYSRLMNQNEEDTHCRATGIRHDLIDPKIELHRGRVVKNTGDGFLAEFASVLDAVRCAIELQDVVALANVGIPAEKCITFRVGLNVGDVIVEPEDIYGDAVNVAARLESLGPPGEVVVSRKVRDEIEGRVDVRFAYLGEHRVKNIARPVHVYRLDPGRSVADGSRSSGGKRYDGAPRRAGRALLLVLFTVWLAVIGGWQERVSATSELEQLSAVWPLRRGHWTPSDPARVIATSAKGQPVDGGIASLAAIEGIVVAFEVP